MRSNIRICSLNELGVEECTFNWARLLKTLGGDTYLFQISFAPNTLVWDECGLGALIFTFLNKMTERRCSSSIAEELFCQLAADGHHYEDSSISATLRFVHCSVSMMNHINEPSDFFITLS